MYLKLQNVTENKDLNEWIGILSSWIDFEAANSLQIDLYTLCKVKDTQVGIFSEGIGNNLFESQKVN